MSTVLVTGAASGIGRLLVDALLGAHRVVAIAHRAPVDSRGGRVEVLEGGLEACDRHAGRIREADVVVHLAAVTHSRDVSRYEQVNHALTRRLVDAMRPGQRLVAMSTICAHPRGGAYGASKWHAEEAIRASGLAWVIVRPAEVYGAASGEGMDAVMAFARRRRIFPDFRAGGPVRYAPVAAARLAGFLVAVVERFVRARATYTVCAASTFTAAGFAAALSRSGRRVYAVPVPVAALRFASRLGVPLPFLPDQLDRLVVPKSYDCGPARDDYGFDPGDVLAELAGGRA